MYFNEDYKREFSMSNLKAQKNFLVLCELIDRYIEEGDYCELYICWTGAEEEERNIELDQTIILNNFDINDIQLYEKTLLKIKK